MQIKKFLELAFVPVYVSAALAFGLIFMSLTMHANLQQNQYQGAVKTEGTADSQTITLNPDSSAPIKLTIKGKLVGSESQNDAIPSAGDMTNLGFGVLGKILINFLAIGVLWMAVMAALKSSKITEGAVKPITDFGSQLGQAAKNLPQYMPIPFPGGKTMTAA